MDSDIVVVGGGPAGAAAAITARQHGLRTTLIERDLAPRQRPGESAHPGIEPLLAKLGVRDAVLQADFVRHEGHWVAGPADKRFVPFGEDASGPWRGFQLWRPTFDAIMLDCALRMGVELLRPCRDARPVVEDGSVTGIESAAASCRARYVIDATGRQRWLARHLDLAVTNAGPPLVAWFGYAEGNRPDRDEAPVFATDRDGWTWTARVRAGLYQWVRISHDAQRPAPDWLPDELCGLVPADGPRGCDVTWSRVRPAAGAGYFLTGDAGFVVDPASSHGVLKAIMSGMMAAHRAAMAIRGALDPAAAASDYDSWMGHWFEHDVAELSKLYAADMQQDTYSAAVRPAPVTNHTGLAKKIEV